MRLLADLKRTVSGFFLVNAKPIYDFETRAERKRRMTSKRNKQLSDSYFAVGERYHKQKGWY